MATAPEVTVALIDLANKMAVAHASNEKDRLARFRTIYRHVYATVEGANGALLSPDKGWDQQTDEGLAEL